MPTKKEIINHLEDLGVEFDRYQTKSALEIILENRLAEDVSEPDEVAEPEPEVAEEPAPTPTPKPLPVAGPAKYMTITWVTKDGNAFKPGTELLLSAGEAKRLMGLGAVRKL